MSTIVNMSSVYYRSRAFDEQITDIVAMKNGQWRNRLIQAIERSGKSQRAIAQAAGLSPGYLGSILKEGKDPSLSRILKVIDQTDASLYWVLYGIEMSKEEQELLRSYARFTSDQKEAFLRLAASTAATAETGH